MFSPNEDARAFSEALWDAERLSEEEWLSWCRMDRPEDLLLSQLYDSWALFREVSDRVYRIINGDPEMLLRPTQPEPHPGLR